ncbi:MAG TPA: alpha-L-rhamnosidase C-terminal domain-containing protein [Pyrinomonadaceae bacterium]|nr:alpha-L-rhamnosidase C-terminal domain-containing protein [Pyrinomonadaceae bacterium]
MQRFWQETRARWIGCGEGGGEVPPFVNLFRRRFALDRTTTIRIYVSADERYELFFDGRRIGRGPERGDRLNWFYESYDLSVQPGEHVLIARVWSLGGLSPVAQMSSRPEFILACASPCEELLATGVADWETQPLRGIDFSAESKVSGFPWFTGPNFIIDGERFAWGFEKGVGQEWKRAVSHESENMIRGYEHLRLMRPAMLPAMMDAVRSVGKVRFASEVKAIDDDRELPPIKSADSSPGQSAEWQRLIDEDVAFTIPPRARRRVLLDLGNYYCAYPQIVTSGGRGSRIRINWAESLFLEPEAKRKGHRDEIEGKHFFGPQGDTFQPDGGNHRRFDVLWWRAGRYVQLLAETADEPLVLHEFGLRETRYPLEVDSTFESNDKRFTQLFPVAVRALQMCAHETYVDCPYYEQLMYVGDTRLQALVTYTINRDDRLPRKALGLFDSSRLPNGLTQSRYPSRILQVIPPFSLWWIAMLHDYALWRGDRAFIQRMLPGARAILGGFAQFLNKDDLVQAPDGWNFVDWVRKSGWNSGVPPGGAQGASAIINWHYVLTLGMAAELEEWAGEPELSARCARLARTTAASTIRAFWDERRGLFADDASRQHFSEHAQCLAVLSGRLDEQQKRRIGTALLRDADLARTTIYFTHYLFETYRALNLPSAMFDRLGYWFKLKEQGFVTTPEVPEPSRSDCHAWGAHPVYHAYATILGIRPRAFGFREVEIAPQFGPLQSATGRLVHPSGIIEAALTIESGRLAGTITLPQTVRGVLRYAGQEQSLSPGSQRVRL